MSKSIKLKLEEDTIWNSGLNMDQRTVNFTNFLITKYMSNSIPGLHTIAEDFEVTTSQSGVDAIYSTINWGSGYTSLYFIVVRYTYIDPNPIYSITDLWKIVGICKSNTEAMTYKDNGLVFNSVSGFITNNQSGTLNYLQIIQLDKLIDSRVSCSVIIDKTHIENLALSGFCTMSNLATSGFVTQPELITFGYTTLNEVKNNLHTSGYIKNTDFISSGFSTLNSVKNDLHMSGYVRNTDFISSGYTTLNIVRSDLYTSGYIRNTDLLSSGYVRSINGLKNTPVLAGSGAIAVWVDGQSIQIGAAGGGGGISSLNGATGPAISLVAGSGVQNSGGPYIRHTTANITSNNTTLADIAGLGYLIGPGEVVCGELTIFFTVATAATGLVLSINGPASPNAVVFTAEIPTSATAVIRGAATVYNTKIIGTAGLTTTLCAYMNFFVTNGPNAGTLIPRMCSEGATVVTVLKGSYAKYQRV